jgi:hypothetical protein
MATPSIDNGPTPDNGRPRTEGPGPLRAAHTPNFPALLRQLGASLLVTTYQAGKLVMVLPDLPLVAGGRKAGVVRVPERVAEILSRTCPHRGLASGIYPRGRP